MTLDELLKTWRRNGILDKRDSVTFSVAELWDGFGQLSFKDRDRYLSLIVGTGNVCHADSVQIERSASELVVRMPGAYLRKQDLQQSFFGLFHSRPPRGADLVLGCLLSRSFEAEAVTIEVRHPELESYLWDSRRPGEYEEAEAGSEELVVKVEFDASWLEVVADWFRRLHTEEDSPECLALAHLCRYSRTEIELEGRKLNQALELGRAPVALARGEAPLLQNYTNKLLQRDAAEWNGVVALDNGPLYLAVRGLLFDGPQDLKLRGLVVCDDLTLDHGRLTVVKNKRYEALLKDLKEQRSVLLQNVDLSEVTYEWGLEMRDFFMAPRIAEHLSLKSKDQMVRWLDLIPEGDDFEQQLAQLKFLYRAAQAFQEAGEGARLEEAAEKAYQRARLMFDDMGRSLDLIDMCAQLCHWLPSRRADAYNWELVAAAEALRKRKEDLEKRLSTVYKNPVGHLARALASLGLYTLARKKRESAKARKNKELFKAELGEISRIEREELENLARQKSDVVLATVGTKLSYLALYEEEIRRVLEER